MKFIDIWSIKMYIQYSYSTRPLTYLKVRLRINAKTYTATRYCFVYRRNAHPLWRHLSSAAFLQTSQTAQTITASCFLPSAQQPLQYRRRAAIVDLSDRSWIRPDRSNAFLETERCIPISYRPSRLPQCNNVATILAADGSAITAKTQEVPRQTAFSNDSQAPSAHANHLRYGLHRSRPLRQTGDGIDRLQPQEEGQAVLPPASVLQRHYQGLLARRTSSRQCTYCCGDYRTFGSVFCQSAALREAHFHPRSQRVFRSQDRRIHRVEESFLCHCGTAYKADKEKALRPVLSCTFIRHRDRRVHVSHQGGAQRVSVHRDPTAHPGRSNGSAFTFLNGQVQLSGHRDQYEAYAPSPLAVLQWPGLGRASYQRTQRRLSPGKDPDETLCSQRSLFSHSLVFVQSHQLVQAAVFAERLSKYDAKYLKASASVNPWRADPFWEQTDVKAT